jgi:integrase
MGRRCRVIVRSDNPHCSAATRTEKLTICMFPPLDLWQGVEHIWIDMKSQSNIKSSEEPGWYRCKRMAFKGELAIWELDPTTRYNYSEAYRMAPRRQLLKANDDDALRVFVRAWGPLRFSLKAWSGSDPIETYRRQRDEWTAGVRFLTSVEEPEMQRSALLKLADFRRGESDPPFRLIPLTGVACSALARLRARAESFGSVEPTHFVFAGFVPKFTFSGKKVVGYSVTEFDPSRHVNSWRTACRALTKKAGFPGFRFHGLRHCTITSPAESGAADSTIMAIAGHVSRKMLERYSHVHGSQAHRDGNPCHKHQNGKL